MTPSPSSRATLPAMRRRRNGAVRAVTATTLVLFAGTFGLLGVNLAAGNDPSLGSGTTTSGTTTIAQTSSASASTASLASSSSTSSAATPAAAQTTTS